MATKNARAIYGLLILTMLIWGGTFVAGKTVAQEVPPLTAAFWRFVLASLALLPLAWNSAEGLWPKRQPPAVWLKLALLGATGMLAYNYCFIKGLSLTQAGRASVIVAINPGLTFLGTVLLFREKCRGWAWLGLVCALLGAVTAITHGRVSELFQGQVGRGELLILGCTVSWAAYSLLGKSVLGRLTPVMATTWACFWGALLLLPLAVLESGPLAFLGFSLKSWLCLAFLGVLGSSVGFTLYYKGIVEIGARRAAIFINLVPVFGLLLGRLFFGESLDWSLLAGLLLVLLGIRFIQQA